VSGRGANEARGDAGAHPSGSASSRRSGARVVLPALALLLALGLVSCGGDGGGDGETLTDRAAPPRAVFPPPNGRTLSQLLEASNAERSNLVVSPTGRVYARGESRFGFGVFTTSREQVTDAQVAIYAAPHGGGRAVGPFPARIDSLQTDPRFEAETTANDPDAAKDVYVTRLRFDRDGPWDLVALFREDGGYSASLIPTIKVGGLNRVPAVNEPAPHVHTPTAGDVHGDLSKIDTRGPHDDMHDVDLADALGHKPVVLLFATPALCQSRVCGPVVDVAEQVKSNFGDRVDFIHMEVYKDNNASEGLRPQMRAFGLPTEPWLFVIDRKGIIRTRIEGAFGVSELERAVRQVAG
jgi:hypothetical protein